MATNKSTVPKAVGPADALELQKLPQDLQQRMKEMAHHRDSLQKTLALLQKQSDRYSELMYAVSDCIERLSELV